MWTQSSAAELGLSGWVRNRRNGSVEALVYGRASKVEEMLRAFRIGPPAALVSSVQIEEVTNGQTPTEFVILPTR
jgi:acylphosphatase